MNQTLVEHAQCMQLSTPLSEQLWAEAINTSFYLANRSLSTAIDYKTPQELWFGKPSENTSL